MKKLILLIIPMLLIGSMSYAQTMTKFSVDLVSPAASAVLTNGTTFNQDFVITVTQGSVTATDTVGWQDPAGAWRTNRVLTKNMGDTIMFSQQYVPNSTAGGASNYCVAAYLRLPGGVIAPNFDTTGGSYISCNSVTINFATGGTGEFTLKKASEIQKLNVYPNPAVGNSISLDYIAQNSSDVEVRIVDLAGRTVLTHSYGKAVKGQEGYSLDISALNQGMYIIELRQEGIKSSGQFIK